MDFYAKIRENKRKSILMLFVSFLLLTVVTGVLFVYLMGDVSVPVFAIGGVISLVLVTIIYFASSKITLALNKAKEVTYDDAPRLHNLVEEMSLAAGISKPRVYIVQDNALNAFATGRNAKEGHVAFTTGLLNTLDREQLQAVTAHELAHIKNEDIKIMTLVAAVASSIVIISDLAMRMLWFGGGNRNSSNGNPIVLIIALLAVIILAPLASAMVQAFISRKREALADYSAVELTRNPAGMKRALESLRDGGTALSKTHSGTAHMWMGNPARKSKGFQFVSKLFSTHPPIDERIEAMSRMAGE